MKSIVICVEYDDFLSITLPINMSHFEHTLVVTAPHDTRTRTLVSNLQSKGSQVSYIETHAFYRNGAHFNKGAAMEEGFNVLRPRDWVVIWDADIIMPFRWLDLFGPEIGNLYVPRRKMHKDISQAFIWDCRNLQDCVTTEKDFAGYFQLFHIDDPHLGPHPWYGIDWTHAGGCDTEFNQHWPVENKIRPPFTVLHLGEDYTNWHGRITPRLDGIPLPDFEQRKTWLRQMRIDRRTDPLMEKEKLKK